MKAPGLALLVLLPAFAQAPPQKGASKPAPAAELSGDQTIRLDVTRVPVLFTVADKKGHFVTDLTKDEFEVVENKKVQTILDFNGESNLPLRLAVLIDTSNKVRQRFKFQQDAATDFIETVVRPGTDKAVVVSFDTTAEQVAAMTDDIAKLNASIRALQPGGGSALYDAIYFACKEKLQDQAPEKFRRAMVILGDGDDNQSRYTRQQALEMAQKADVVIYGVSTNNSGQEEDGDKILRYFAQETGGQVFIPFQESELAQSFANIANELRHQYIVVYRPEPLKADGQYHTLDIRVKGRKDLTVRARHGYYAPLAADVR
ncbi:MAG TPA: VWA domain-containing protein [Bryobacteraceae bacterium]|jgi:VWFA-related protein